MRLGGEEGVVFEKTHYLFWYPLGCVSNVHIDSNC